MTAKKSPPDERFKKISHLYHLYTKGLKSEDFERLIRRDTMEAYRFLRSSDEGGEEEEKTFSIQRLLREAKGIFLGFTLKLSPVRRIIFIAALAVWLVSIYQVLAGASSIIPYIVGSFLLLTFLLALELVDKLTIKGDLEIAREIQFVLLPAGRYRREGRITVHAATIPANTVGGDYYDLLELDDERLGLVIGDVSGKGIPAALLMAYLQASLRALAGDRERSLSELMATINRHISRNTPSNSLITFFYGILDLRTGRLSYSNAGHNRPMLVKPDGRTIELCEGGMPLGIEMGLGYAEGTIDLEPDDLLFMYTDGVTEAANSKGDEFDLKRLRNIVVSNRGRTPEELAGLVIDSVKRFVGDNRFRDDLTMLIARIERASAQPPPAVPPA